MAANTIPAAILERGGHTFTTIVDEELRGCYVTEVEPPFPDGGLASTVLTAAGAVLESDPEGRGITKVTFTDRYATGFVSPDGAIGETALMHGLSERIGDTVMDGELAAAV